MASFYYYDKDPSRFCFLLQIGALNLTEITKFKYEKKNEKNSGRSSKVTPSCKWPIDQEWGWSEVEMVLNTLCLNWWQSIVTYLQVENRRSSL